VLFHEGQQDHIHISIVAKRAILVVIFDERSSLGLVRLRVKRGHADLEHIFEAMMAKSREAGHTPDSPFSEITDADIDALFGEGRLPRKAQVSRHELRMWVSVLYHCSVKRGGLTPGITRRPERLSEDDSPRVGGRVQSLVMLRTGMQLSTPRLRGSDA
jgi:hypothetical protein